MLKGITATRHIQTPSQLIPCVYISWHAVVAISPPTVRFADQRRKLPLVLNAWLMSNAFNSARKSIDPDEFFDFVVISCAVVEMHEPLANANAREASLDCTAND